MLFVTHELTFACNRITVDTYSTCISYVKKVYGYTYLVPTFLYSGRHYKADLEITASIKNRRQIYLIFVLEI